MNFLSHYYADRHKSNPYFLAGISMPDLMRGFSRTYNSKIKKAHFLDSDFNELATGIRSHYELDAYFHNCPYFNRKMKLITDRLKGMSFNSITSRHYFLAHVFIEMMIDRCIIKSHPGLIDRYYHLMSQIDVEDIVQQFKQHNIPINDQELRQAYRGFNNFRFLYKYLYNDQFVYGLTKIYKKATGIEVSIEDKALLCTQLDQLEQLIAEDWYEVFEQTYHAA